MQEIADESEQPQKRRMGTTGRNPAGHSVREMIEVALLQEGGVDYLRGQARDNPTAFMALLGKIVPRDLNVSGNVEMTVRQELVEEAVCLLLGREAPAHLINAVQEAIGEKLVINQTQY